MRDLEGLAIPIVQGLSMTVCRVINDDFCAGSMWHSLNFDLVGGRRTVARFPPNLKAAQARPFVLVLLASH